MERCRHYLIRFGIPLQIKRTLGVGKGEVKSVTTLVFKEAECSIKSKMDAGNTSTPLLQEKSELNSVPSDIDHIDRLPDDILIVILSLLTLKEAGITSIVSRRWRYLWMYTTGCWSFDFSEKTKMLIEMGFRNVMKVLPYLASKNIYWVTQVLALHRGPYLDEFRINAYLDASTATQVDQLLYFASRKGVQKLELDFKTYFTFLSSQRYSFPNLENFKHLLTSGDNVLLRCQHHLRGVTLGVHDFRSFCCLRSLCLRYVDVTEEVLSCFFSNCLLLERLSLEGSYHLLHPKVHGIHLRHCEIMNCFNLKSLEISAVDLESFTYLGPNIDVPFQSVPRSLLEVTIGGSFGESFVFETAKHLVYLSQLESLTFDVSFDVNSRISRFPTVFPEMINLKHLVVKVSPTGSQSLLAYTTFIKASPFLSTFKMEYCLHGPFPLRESILGRYPYQRIMSEATKFAHQHLEKVELIGFHACATDLNLASRLLDNAVNLKKMVLQFRTEEMRDHRVSRKHVGRLRAKVPPGVELVVC